MSADPAAVVAWFGAVQAQDYAGAKWALTLRAPALTDAQLDRALADGTIIRTHGPRPTWHFIAPADIRWVLTAVAPRVQLRTRTMYRTYEVDAPLLTRVRRVVEKALGGNQFATRVAIGKALAAKGIEASGIRLGLIMFVLELDQVVCSGPRAGKQFTYALFDERVRAAVVLGPEDARTALAARYAASHGPVTVNDFVWWSGLTVGEARRALEAVSPALRTEQLGGDTYWSSPTEPKATKRAVPPVHLMPNYDEYFIAYRDRRPTAALLPPNAPADPMDSFAHLLCVEGRFGGFWRRTVGSRKVAVQLLPYRALSRVHVAAAEEAAERYAAFLGLPLDFSVRPA
ncbi:MAG: winged helix DNA-binding domain-containing protein [Vicinamibacteraceae bacterium]